MLIVTRRKKGAAAKTLILQRREIHLPWQLYELYAYRLENNLRVQTTQIVFCRARTLETPHSRFTPGGKRTARTAWCFQAEEKLQPQILESVLRSQAQPDERNIVQGFARERELVVQRALTVSSSVGKA